jgi:PhnB protein
MSDTPIQIQPYLFFEGRCEEALGFYRKALGAEVTRLARFKEAPEGSSPAANAEKVMHASFRVGDATVMASDGTCGGKPNFQGFSLTLAVPDDATAARLFGALAEGGQIHQGLTRTFFASSFGMLADKFGVSWMVIAFPPAP